jgi:hypothetical protein
LYDFNDKEVVEEYKQETIDVETYTKNEDEAIVVQEEISKDDIVFSDDGLEFFGEEELVKEEIKEVSSVPFVEEVAKVEEKLIKDDFKEIDNVYGLLKENNENNAYSELKDEVEINCEKINQKLMELNIKASVNNYIIGPCVTRYEIVPEIGVRVSSIVNIENDLKLSEKVLKLNKILAFSGPTLTCLAAFGSVFLGCVNSSWPMMLGIICGALASIVNTIEHGGQVGMIFEFYRTATGFFKLMEDTIELNMNEEDYLKRENGELFEIKVALKLGRSVSELRQFSDELSSEDYDNVCEEFASKLF